MAGKEGHEIEARRPIGIDLFAGAGGLSLGFEQAGFDVKAAVEVDPVHCAIHKFNFPQSAVICKTVTELTGAEIRRIAGIGNDAVDCVFGGPPCQGFSMIGHRSSDDPRNSLVLEFVRIVAELEARTFVFENVKGLTVGKQQHFLDEIVRAFERAGYAIRLPWQVLDAANYGAPQHRQRLILMGAKKGVTVPEYPKECTIPADTNRSLYLPVGPTVFDAIGDLPDVEQFPALNNSDCVRTNSFGEPSPYASELRCLTRESWYLGYVREWDAGVLTSSARTAHTTISRRRFSSTDQGDVEPVSRLFKLPSSGLSNTLRAGTDAARGAFTSPRPIHYAYNRCVTVREMARLHGFPDWFRFHATKWHGARQIGNAVPPPLARAVACEVISTFRMKMSRPEDVLQLHEDCLLYMDMTRAARYFEVVPPSSSRNRKSGATKRKQHEIEATRIQQEVAYGAR